MLSERIPGKGGLVVGYSACTIVRNGGGGPLCRSRWWKCGGIAVYVEFCGVYNVCMRARWWRRGCTSTADLVNAHGSGRSEYKECQALRAGGDQREIRCQGVG